MCSANIKCAIPLLFLIIIGNSVVFTIDTSWWKHMILYEVYIASFKDSNGDGIGDIKGITQKLDHFVDLGIESIHITPFFKSPKADFGYDISNFTEIDPMFGTMLQFDELIDEMNSRGLKLIMDLVINHSSDEHPWFQKSVDRIDPYTDFYVWADAKNFDQNRNPIPPNNWFSVFGGSAWEWNERRGQFYLHKFAVKQPDFNLRSVKVKKEVKEILKFWMDRGVAGFRLDAPKHFVEDKLLRDEPLLPGKTVAITKADLIRIYTIDLWESYEVVHELKDFTDQYSRIVGHSHEKIFVAETYSNMNHTMAYYGTENYRIANFPYNMNFVMLDSYRNASVYNDLLLAWFKNMPKGATANWMAENHDMPRVNKRLSEEYMDIVTITMMMLPGVACIYYGQEIGMKNGVVRRDQMQDPLYTKITPERTRDHQRLPMQWDDTMNAGFTSKLKPWLPVDSNYWKVNVEAQKMQEISRYNMFRVLSKIRRRKTMKWGSFEPYILSEWVYAFVRSLPRHEKYITVFNLGSEIEQVDFHNTIPHLPPKLEVVVTSINAGYNRGDEIQSRPKFPTTFPMRPLSAVVLSTKPHRTPFSKFATQLSDSAFSVHF